ncbi:MAG TPA: hypothetical protein VIG30_06845, partial [Ktedonobacterales bacterium]
MGTSGGTGGRRALRGGTLHARGIVARQTRQRQGEERAFDPANVIRLSGEDWLGVGPGVHRTPLRSDSNHPKVESAGVRMPCGTTS